MAVAALQALASTLQLLFMNDTDIRHECRRALFSVATAWTDSLDLPKPDRSVAKVMSLPDLPACVMSGQAVLANSCRRIEQKTWSA